MLDAQMPIASVLFAFMKSVDFLMAATKAFICSVLFSYMALVVTRTHVLYTSMSSEEPILTPPADSMTVAGYGWLPARISIALVPNAEVNVLPSRYSSCRSEPAVVLYVTPKLSHHRLNMASVEDFSITPTL